MQRRDEEDRRHAAGAGADHHGSNGHDAAGQRDRRGAGSAGVLPARRGWVELRDRARGDERCGALSVPERDHADQRAAQRGTAAKCGRARRLQADARGVCRAPSQVCVGVRSERGGRMLRDNAGTHQGRGGGCGWTESAGAREQAAVGGGERFFGGAAGGGWAAGDYRGGDERHDARHALQRHGAQGRLRRHLHAWPSGW